MLVLSFKEYLNEAPDGQKRLIADLRRALDSSVRTAHKLNHIISATWKPASRKFLSVYEFNLRVAFRSAGVRGFASFNTDAHMKLALKTMVMFELDVVDTRPDDGPLGTQKLPFLAAVVVNPVNGDMFAIPSLLNPRAILFSHGGPSRPLHHQYGIPPADARRMRVAPKHDVVRIKEIVARATKNLVFYARNHKSLPVDQHWASKTKRR